MNRETKKLNNQNNILDKQISKENQKAFTDLICYLRGSDLSDHDIELVRQDLSEMVLSAQDRGENIAQVIGADYQGFCDSVIASLPPKSKKQKIIASLDVLCWGLAILIGINIVMNKAIIVLASNLISGKVVNYDISFTVGTVVSIVLIMALANGLVKAITRNAFEKLTHGPLVLFGLMAVMMALFLGIAYLGRDVLFTANIFIVSLVAISLYGAHKLLESI